MDMVYAKVINTTAPSEIPLGSVWTAGELYATATVGDTVLNEGWAGSTGSGRSAVLKGADDVIYLVYWVDDVGPTRKFWIKSNTAGSIYVAGKVSPSMYIVDYLRYHWWYLILLAAIVVGMVWYCFK